MAIEIVSFPMKNGDFPKLCESLPEGIKMIRSMESMETDSNSTLTTRK